MADEGEKEPCDCLSCRLLRVIEDFVTEKWPQDMPGRPSAVVISAALAECAAVAAVQIASVLDERHEQRFVTDAALKAIMKFRMSITDTVEFVDLETGVSTPVADLLATKH